MKTIYFDMDGTIYDLYSVNGWLEKLHREDVSPYVEGNALVDLTSFNDLCKRLTDKGYRIGIISWTAKNSSKNYNAAVRNAKRAWINENMPYVTETHIVKYGTPKHYTARDKRSILIDDSADVRAAWIGRGCYGRSTIDASNSRNMMQALNNMC